ASGLRTGDYRWKLTFVTASGETLASPASSVLTLGGALAAPSSAPSATKQLGGNLSAGVYKWKYSYLTASGETLASSESNSVTMDDVAAPSTIGTASDDFGSCYPASAAFGFVYTFVNHADPSRETTQSPVANVTLGSSLRCLKMTRAGVASPPAGFDRQFYRTVANGSVYKKMSGSSDGFYSDNPTYYFEIQNDGSLGATVPSSNTAVYRSASVSVVASTNPLV